MLYKAHEFAKCFHFFRINTLYMYRSDEDELPENFWLLNENCFICPGRLSRDVISFCV